MIKSNMKSGHKIVNNKHTENIVPFKVNSLKQER